MRLVRQRLLIAEHKPDCKVGLDPPYIILVMRDPYLLQLFPLDCAKD